MNREEARVVVHQMLDEYATAMAWHPEDIPAYLAQAKEALESLGISRNDLERF